MSGRLGIAHTSMVMDSRDASQSQQSPDVGTCIAGPTSLWTSLRVWVSCTRRWGFAADGREVAVMSRKKVLVLGGNFGGLTAALAVNHELHGDVDVRVVAASDRFLFNPSLIWLPFGKRRPTDITFPLAPTFESHGVGFAHADATSL